jgi:DNA-binding IclR family transcriptional regulator
MWVMLETDRMVYMEACQGSARRPENINGLAVPLLTGEGNFVLDCGGPSYLLPPNRMRDEIGPKLAKIARKIRESMGVPSGS